MFGTIIIQFVIVFALLQKVDDMIMKTIYAYIYPSELKAICTQASKYQNTETGGDLYGTWTEGGAPVIFLATGPGRQSSGDRIWFDLDKDSILRNNEYLFDKFGIQYLGDWHSHHVLDLDRPSPGDRERISRIMINSQRSKMFEIIVNHVLETSESRKWTLGKKGHVLKEKLSPFYYNYANRTTQMYNSVFCILKEKKSPVRERLEHNNSDVGINFINQTFTFDLDQMIFSGNAKPIGEIEAESKCFLDLC